MMSIKNALVRADQSLFLTINRRHIGYLNRFFLIITNMGGLTSHVCLIAILTMLPSTRQLGIRLGYVQIVVTAVVQAFKLMVARVRPYNAMDCFIPLKTERDYSFPSGHTAAAFSSAITISTAIPAVTDPVILLAVLIGYSRIYLGIHYPSDVLAGGLLGIGLTVVLL